MYAYWSCAVAVVDFLQLLNNNAVSARGIRFEATSQAYNGVTVESGFFQPNIPKIVRVQPQLFSLEMKTKYLLLIGMLLVLMFCGCYILTNHPPQHHFGTHPYECHDLEQSCQYLLATAFFHFIYHPLVIKNRKGRRSDRKRRNKAVHAKNGNPAPLQFVSGIEEPIEAIVNSVGMNQFPLTKQTH